MEDHPCNNADSGVHQKQAASSSFPFRGSHHRRAHSEVNFRLPPELDLVSEPFDPHPSGSFEEMGSEDDLFCTYMDMEKLGSATAANINSGHNNNNNVNANGGAPDQHHLLHRIENSHNNDNDEVDDKNNVKGGGRHRHSNSVDGSSILDSIEAKKAMAPDKLAELWNLDPKRAKRILANRQSAARSKERKARYISELERKVQTLQTEATTLSAQFTLFQRDTTSLSAENTELKLRLQAMEHQAELRDALNEALKKEVERLKMATGEMITPTDSYNFGMHHVPFNQSSVFSQQSQPATGRNEGQHIQMSQFRQFQSSMGGHHQSLGTQSQSQALSNMFQQDPLGRMQGLDINGRGPHLVKSEGPSISASESNSTF